MGNWGLSREEPRGDAMMGFLVRADGFASVRNGDATGTEALAGAGLSSKGFPCLRNAGRMRRGS